MAATTFYIPPEMRETALKLFLHVYWLGYRDALVANSQGDTATIAHAAELAAAAWLAQNRVDFESILAGAPTPAEPADD